MKSFRWNQIIDWNRRSTIFKQFISIFYNIDIIRIISKNENIIQI